MRLLLAFFFFFFNDTATTEIYTLSLHDALPIYLVNGLLLGGGTLRSQCAGICQLRHRTDRLRAQVAADPHDLLDRKSTRLNSSHQIISYAVFCLKKKKHNTHPQTSP